MINFDSVTGAFFETLIALMVQFFQIYSNKAKEELTKRQSESEEEKFFKQLMENYYESKKRFERSLVLTFQLVGSPALQRWIKTVVRYHLQTKGYYLLEDVKNAPFSRRVTLSNKKMLKDNPHVVYLPAIPEEKEIKRALRVIDW